MVARRSPWSRSASSSSAARSSPDVHGYAGETGVPVASSREPLQLDGPGEWRSL